MGRFIEIGADRRQRLALARAMKIGDDHAHLGRERNRARQELLRRLRADRRVVIKAQHGHARAQDVHQVGVLRRVLQEVDDRRRQCARGAQVGLELRQLRLVRQRLVPEEIDDLLVADAPRQLVDVVTGVNEDALLAHDITEARGGGDDSLKSRRSDGHKLNQLTSRVPLCHRKQQWGPIFRRGGGLMGPLITTAFSKIASGLGNAN